MGEQTYQQQKIESEHGNEHQIRHEINFKLSMDYLAYQTFSFYEWSESHF